MRYRVLPWMVIALLLSGCGTPADPLADAAEPPPSEPPYMTGEVLDIVPSRARTENCNPESEADTNNDGFVTDRDGPVCHPDPGNGGSVHLRGYRKDQGGEGIELIAYIGGATRVLARDGTGYRRAAFTELAEGDEVSVWIDYVMESDPLQGDANRLVLP